MATVTYDPEADALGILFAPGPSEGEEVSPGVILHFDGANRIVEIEIPVRKQATCSRCAYRAATTRCRGIAATLANLCRIMREKEDRGRAGDLRV